MLIFYLAPVFGQLGGNSFRHHWIVQDLPGNRDSGYGCPTLADFDRDGDLDFSFSNTGGHVYWFENTRTVWLRHIVGPIDRGQLGSVTTDVDGDGCFWYEIPESSTGAERQWVRHTITLDVLNDRDDIHAGFVPGGVADLDGDGDADVVLPDRWLENLNRGESWREHRLSFGSRGPWGLSSRSWITDIDGDGMRILSWTDSDQVNSGVAILYSDGGSPPNFGKPQFLANRASGTRGPFTLSSWPILTVMVTTTSLSRNKRTTRSFLSVPPPFLHFRES